MSATPADTDSGQPPPGDGASPIRTLLGDPDYLYIWLVGGLTGVIRWLQLLVMGIYTFEVTGSPLLVSIVPMLWMLPLALCGPFVGVLADRLNRKHFLIGSLGMITAVSVAMGVVAATATLTFEHIAIASLLSGLFWATDMPVRRRLLGDLSRGLLSTAMSLDSATGNATRMAGPVLGGVLLQVFSMTGVFIASAVVFLACIVMVIMARVPERDAQPAGLGFVREFLAGLRFVLGDQGLRRIFAVTIVFNIWGFPFTSMIPVIGSDVLSLDPLMIGLLSSAEGVGAFIGALAVALYATPAHFFRIYVLGTTAVLAFILHLAGLTFFAGGPLHSFIACCITLTAIGISAACFATMQGTLTYAAAPPAYRSRVLGVLTLCIGTGPIGFLNVGLMAEFFGVPAALAIISLEGLFAMLVLWAFGKSGNATW